MVNFNPFAKTTLIENRHNVAIIISLATPTRVLLDKQISPGKSIRVCLGGNLAAMQASFRARLVTELILNNVTHLDIDLLSTSSKIVLGWAEQGVFVVQTSRANGFNRMRAMVEVMEVVRRLGNEFPGMIQPHGDE